MTGARATSALAGTRFVAIRWVTETGSTNADVLTEARRGAAEGLVVVADHQTAGRGRRDRTWTAPPGGSLLVSVLVRPPADVSEQVPMAFGLALVDAVCEVAAIRPVLKWPNDLVTPGPGVGVDRKLAGLLAEVDWPTGSAPSKVAMVLGLGLNVNWRGIEPDDVADVALALDAVTRHPVDREDLLIALLQRFDARYDRLVSSVDEPAAVVAEWRAQLGTLGRRVQVTTHEVTVEGLAVDVTAEGHLVVETDDGVRLSFSTGDVIHLRDARGD